MSKYSQGICGDGAAILEDGQMMTIDAIVGRLNSLTDMVTELRQPSHKCEIGIYGKAYDRQGKCRAYTFQHQPHNQEAYRIGLAAKAACTNKSGDHIDTGLWLLKNLDSIGLGVFELGQKATEEPSNEG